jgi:hypothetical protein
MQHNFKCYSISFFILSPCFTSSARSPPFTSLSLDPTDYCLPLVCVCVRVGWREDSPLWLLLFVRCNVQVLSLCSLTPTRQADTQTSCWCCLAWSPFFLFSVHFETATLRGRSSPAEPRKGFRIYDYFLSGISGSLIIPPMAGSNNNNNKKTTCWRGWTFHFVWLLN